MLLMNNITIRRSNPSDFLFYTKLYYKAYGLSHHQIQILCLSELKIVNFVFILSLFYFYFYFYFYY